MGKLMVDSDAQLDGSQRCKKQRSQLLVLHRVVFIATIGVASFHIPAQPNTDNSSGTRRKVLVTYDDRLFPVFWSSYTIYAFRSNRWEASREQLGMTYRQHDSIVP